MAILHWEDVRDGEELPSYSLHLDDLRFFLQGSGSQDFHLQHVDEAFARRQGVPHRFVNTGFSAAALSRVVTDWMGDEGFLKKFGMQMRKMNVPGDTMTMRGKVTKVYLDGEDGCVDLELWAENEREGMTTPGSATVVLPRRQQ